jgi:hypothetical protein
LERDGGNHGDDPLHISIKRLQQRAWKCATALAALAFAADAVPAPPGAAVLLLDNTGRPLACRVRTVRAVLTHDDDWRRERLNRERRKSTQASDNVILVYAVIWMNLHYT